VPRYGREQDRRFARMDEPAHVFEGGGVNGRATIKGVPTRSDASGTGLVRSGQRTGLMSEPVAVVLRDAVTIDTAVRLTGADRATIQNAAAKSYLPSLKLGGATTPYLVRMRDVIAYLARATRERRLRTGTAGKGGFQPGRDFLGFPPWLVERVKLAYQDGAVVTGTPFATEVITPNRGGRPRIRPPKTETQSGEKPIKAVRDHAPTKRRKRRRARSPKGPQAPALVQAAVSVPPPALPERPKAAPRPPKVVDPTTLPKWHPLWRRPGT
jgi:hypothetical protein